MTTISNKVVRLTTLLALVLSCILAISPPFGFLIMAYEHQSAVLETEAEAAAAFVTQLISANPDYWKYELPRLEGFLSQRPLDRQQEIRRIVDAGNTVLTQNAVGLPLPLITRSHVLYDSGKVVARIEISRSLRPVLFITFALAFIGAGLGGGSFLLLRVYPLRALKQALKSLQESEDKFRAIAATAADAIVVMDDRGSITFWNAAAEKIFGYPLREAMGTELHSLIAPSSFRGSFLKGFGQFVRTGQGPAIGSTIEFTAIRKDGTEFPIEVSVSAVELGGAWHAVGIIRDISERKKTEQELLKLDKIESLGVLAGGIAHDFNNLLTVILGNVALAQLDTDPSDRSYVRLTDMEKAVLRARELTQQLLTFAKGGAPIKKTVSLREIIEESCSLTLSGSNVKCDFSFGESLQPADVDPGQISQVMHNLIINAVQAMPQGGSIHIACANVAIGPGDGVPIAAGPYLKISVRDKGHGIPAEHLSKVFDPYFTTKPKGSGLGLATSYSIIRRHGGLIALESEVDVGSVFHVYLPASEGRTPEDSFARIVTASGFGKVLIMDDELSVRHVAGEMLNALGYEPSFARDGAEALVLYQAAAKEGKPFAAVIMDLTVPGGMGGRDAIVKMLEIDPLARVIVASGYSNDPVMSAFRAHGFSGVIAKPFTLDLLGRTLRSVLNNERSS